MSGMPDRAHEAVRRAMERGGKQCFDCGRPYMSWGGHFNGPIWVCCACLGPHDDAALVKHGFQPGGCHRPPEPPKEPYRARPNWPLRVGLTLTFGGLPVFFISALLGFDPLLVLVGWVVLGWGAFWAWLCYRAWRV